MIKYIVVPQLKVSRYQNGIDYAGDFTIMAVRVGTDSHLSPYEPFSLRIKDSQVASKNGTVEYFSKYDISSDAQDLLSKTCFSLLLWETRHHVWRGVIGGSATEGPSLNYAKYNGHWLSSKAICEAKSASTKLMRDNAAAVAAALSIDEKDVAHIRRSSTVIFYKE